MSDFWLWFTTGIQHITDLEGYDHILFLALLVVTFPVQHWKKILILVTLFTLGHTISLALSATHIVNVNQGIVELLIALTILSSAIYNLVKFKTSEPEAQKALYFIVPLFGIIHGLGFSYLLRSMLGEETNVTLPLLYFNLGLEIGQVAIILVLCALIAFMTLLLKIPHKFLKLAISCAGILLTLGLILDRIAFLVRL